jgi:hypothetical protein
MVTVINRPKTISPAKRLEYSESLQPSRSLPWPRVVSAHLKRERCPRTTVASFPSLSIWVAAPYDHQDCSSPIVNISTRACIHRFDHFVKVAGASNYTFVCLFFFVRPRQRTLYSNLSGTTLAGLSASFSSFSPSHETTGNSKESGACVKGVGTQRSGTYDVHTLLYALVRICGRLSCFWSSPSSIFTDSKRI